MYKQPCPEIDRHNEQLSSWPTPPKEILSIHVPGQQRLPWWRWHQGSTINIRHRRPSRPVCSSAQISFLPLQYRGKPHWYILFPHHYWHSFPIRFGKYCFLMWRLTSFSVGKLVCLLVQIGSLMCSPMWFNLVQQSDYMWQKAFFVLTYWRCDS